MAPNEKQPFHEKLRLKSKTPNKSNAFDRESPVFEERMKERGSMYEHCPLCGSARAAIRGRISKKEFPKKQIAFQKC